MIRRWPLTVRGTGAVVLALAAFILANELGTALLLYLGVLLLVIVGLSFLLLHVGRRVSTPTRALAPEVVPVGGRAHVTVRLEYASVLPVSMIAWTDRLPTGLSGTAAGEFPPLPATSGHLLAAAYDVTGDRRGPHRIGPFELTTIDPFGLVRRRQRTAGETSVLVVPAPVELAPIAEFSGDLGGVVHSSNDAFGQGADNLIARPYAPGDSMRRIHWRASARRDELMVREEERESTPEATVVLDRSASHWHPDARREPGSDPAFEAALTTLVSIVHRLTTEGYLVDVLDGDGTPFVEPLAGADSGADFAHLLEATAHLRAADSDQLPRLVPLFSSVSAGPVFLITGALAAADVDLVAPIAPHSALPVLLCTHTPPAVRDVAAASWRVGRIGPGDDLPLAWADTTGGRFHVAG